MKVDTTAVKSLNAVLDRERKEHALPNDNELARHLGISSKTLSFWRNGKRPKSTVVILKLVAPPQPEVSEAAA